MKLAAGDPRLAAFHRGIYWDAFAAQHEPLAAWERALAGEAPYRLTVEVEPEGGITYELYPESRCGFMTYLVVAPHARGTGVGRRLLDGAIRDLRESGARAVFAEVDDPRVHGAAAWPRLLRFQRWGARVVDARYVQPALGLGLPRDRRLALIAFDDIDGGGATVRAFVHELYRATEGGPPDPEIAIPDDIALHCLVDES